MKKYKNRLLIILISLSFSFVANAEALRGINRESKFKDVFANPSPNPSPSSGDSGLGGLGGGTLEEFQGPVGDSLWLITTLGLGYTVYISRKRQYKSAKSN
jgi:hypothetical protein